LFPTTLLYAQIIVMGKTHNLVIGGWIVALKVFAYHETLLPSDDAGLHISSIVKAMIGTESCQTGAYTFNPVAGAEPLPVTLYTFDHQIIFRVIVHIPS